MSETRWVRARCDTSACVELGALSYGDYAIRNSNFRADKVVFTRKEMMTFLSAVKAGEFDRLFEGPQ